MRLVDGRLVNLWALGLRAGYWPCLDAFFVELSLGPWRPAVWFGRSLTEKSEAVAA